jgi:hypothetical protein
MEQVKYIQLIAVGRAGGKVDAVATHVIVLGRAQNYDDV